MLCLLWWLHRLGFGQQPRDLGKSWEVHAVDDELAAVAVLACARERRQLSHVSLCAQGHNFKIYYQHGSGIQGGMSESLRGCAKLFDDALLAIFISS